MEFRQCEACHQPFRPRPQNPDQCFCSAAACQRERRRRWQAAKRQNDPDYRDNQKRAQKAWAERHPDYWRAYREQHPEYVARNRARQRERAPAPAGVAKMDASMAETGFSSGTYRLSRVVDASLAKKNAWMVEITVISAACASP
ncbi:hypothetical protein [Candidatus Accumulibacter sp. ACC003]|uniref:hypothetical protein n=1 Tax=Candidatus Accumulibacter sp. ACC003 TaxID=2823334 RepID=UPI0025BA88DA|nr:hypothetical protein [Candidatus Accumulibacter sp. ACC003]